MSEIKLKELVKLVEEYGADMTIGQILEEKSKPYTCPVCVGQGNLGRFMDKKEPLSALKGIDVPVLTYLLQTHIGLNGDCTLCKGEGFLEEDLVPVKIEIVAGYSERPNK